MVARPLSLLRPVPRHPRGLAAAGWKAGGGKEAITPEEPIWMAGYGARDQALGRGRSRPLGEGPRSSRTRRAERRPDRDPRRRAASTARPPVVSATPSRRDHGLDDDRVVLACSHTHCGPVVGENLLTMYRARRRPDAQQVARIHGGIRTEHPRGGRRRPSRRLEPVDLSWETGPGRLRREPPDEQGSRCARTPRAERAEGPRRP